MVKISRKDPADTGGRALKRLHKTGVIVRFDFERGDQTVADIHHTRIFARALNDEFSAHRQALQMHLAGFVRAVLAPHHAENAQLGYVGIASEDLLHARIFRSREAVLRGDFRRNFNFRACRRQFSYLEITRRIRLNLEIMKSQKQFLKINPRRSP